MCSAMNYNAVRLRGYNLIIIKPKSLNYFLFGIILGRGCKYREFWYRVNFHIDWLKSAPVFSAGSDDDEGPILYFPQRILSLTVTLGPGHNLSVCIVDIFQYLRMLIVKCLLLIINIPDSWGPVRWACHRVCCSHDKTFNSPGVTLHSAATV